MSYFPNAAIQTIGAVIPPAAELMGGSDGTDIRALLVSVTGQLHTLVDNFPATQPISGSVSISNFPATQPISGTVAATQSGVWAVGVSAGQTIAVTNAGTFAVQDAAAEASLATIAGTVSGGKINVALASTTITGSVAVTGTFWQATQPVSGTVAVSNFPATQPISGTVTALQGTSPWVTSLASTTITGSVAVTGTFWQATQPVSGTIAISNFPATVAVTQSTSPWVVSLASTTITGSVAVTGTFWQALQNVDLLNWGGSGLSSTGVTSYGTAPVGTAQVIGVNAFVTNAITVSGALTNNNAAPAATNVGVLPAVANAANPALTEGDQVLLSVDLTGHQRVTGPTSSTANAVGSTAVTSTASIILAANTARLEFTITNTGVVAVYLAFNTKVPTATAFHIMLSPCAVAYDGTGGTFTSDLIKGQIQAIVASTAGTVAVLELTV